MFLGLGLSFQSRGGDTTPTAPSSTVAPAISGTEVSTQTLSCTSGSWAAYPAPAYTYQWQRDVAGNGVFSNIASATASTYLLDSADDINNKLRCRVTATNASGNATASSNTTGFIGLADTVPLAFSFTDVTGAALTTVYTSNSILVTSVNLPTAITITGGTYSINGGAYTSSAGTVVFGDTVTVRVTSSGSYLTPANAALTIGGVSDTYSVTTIDDPSDGTPDQFTFTDIIDAVRSTVYTSNSITVSGINTASAISIVGGTYSVNGGAYTASAGTVVNGDAVTVRVTTSASYFTNTHGTLNIGGVTDTYTVRTLVDPTIVDGASLGLLLAITKGSGGGGGGSTAGESTGLLLGITKSS